MALLWVESTGTASRVVTDPGTLTLLAFSRGQEQKADREALAAVNKNYGHTAGELDLYEVLLKHADGSLGKVSIFLATHPLTDDRVQELKLLQSDLGGSTAGTTTPPIAALIRQ